MTLAKIFRHSKFRITKGFFEGNDANDGKISYTALV